MGTKLSGALHLLRSDGYRTELFATAMAFLASSGALRSNCIITDIQMPGLSGFELKRRLNAEENMTPVIMITGHSEEQLDGEARDSGAICLLRKPFAPHVLLSWVGRTLGR